MKPPIYVKYLLTSDHTEIPCSAKNDGYACSKSVAMDLIEGPLERYASAPLVKYTNLTFFWFSCPIIIAHLHCDVNRPSHILNCIERLGYFC